MTLNDIKTLTIGSFVYHPFYLRGEVNELTETSVTARFEYEKGRFTNRTFGNYDMFDVKESILELYLAPVKIVTIN